jgi:hypothetical protein
MKTRIISTEIWDEDTVFRLNIDTKLLYLILLTNPYIGQSRFYKISDRQLSTFSGLNIEQIQKCKKDLEDANMVFFKDNYVCITGYGFIECFYKGAKNEKAKAKEIASIPSDIYNFFYKKLETLGIIEKEKQFEIIIDNINKYGRKKMTNTRRERILNLKGNRCNVCGNENCLLEIDHITPLHLKGSEEDDNLQVLCESCHSLKTAQETKNRESSDTLYESSDTTINHKSEIINNKSEIINEDFQVPEWIDRESWNEWLTHRKQRKLASYKELGLKKLFTQLENEFGKDTERLKKAIDWSISKNYQGIYEPKAFDRGKPENVINKNTNKILNALRGK